MMAVATFVLLDSHVVKVIRYGHAQHSEHKALSKIPARKFETLASHERLRSTGNETSKEKRGGASAKRINGSIGRNGTVREEQLSRECSTGKRGPIFPKKRSAQR